MMKFELRQLEYFAKTAETGSFAQAAKGLFIAPQAVSRGVQNLEAAIGAPLFERTSNDIALTDFGEGFLEKTRDVLAATAALEGFAREQSAHPQRKKISVGLNPLCGSRFGGTLGGKALFALQDRNPRMNLEFVELQGEAIKEGVAAGTLDFGVNGTIDANRCESVLLADYRMAIVTSKESAPFAGKASVSLRDLARGTMVCSPGERAFYDGLRFLVEREGGALEASPIRTLADDDMPNDGSFVVRPLQHALRTASEHDVAALPLTHGNGMPVTSPLYLFWRKRRLSPDEKRFVASMASAYACDDDPR